MLSFRQIIDENSEKIKHNHQGLFRQLRSNPSCRTSSYMTQSNATKIMEWLKKKHQLELEILKFEKVNYVVQMHLTTRTPISTIMKQVRKELDDEIKGMVLKKLDVLLEQKYLEQTVANTDDSQSVSRKPNKQNRGSEIQKSPKIVQFTLGNRQISSAESNNGRDNHEQEVSQFQVNNNKIMERIY